MATGASSSTVVTLQVPSATTIDGSACATGSAATAFGSALPGSSLVSSSDCVVTFSSSNDSASLLLAQQDASGTAMAALATGALDTAGFGVAASGKVTAPVGPGNIYARPSAVAPDGKILIATYRNPTAAGDPFTVTRLLADGSGPDTSFAGGGTATITLGSGNTYARGLAVQPDRKVIVVGASDYGVGRGVEWSIVRFLENGTPDPSFGTGGVVTLQLSSGTDQANAVVVRPDGKVVVGGHSWVSATSTYDTVFAQLLPDGSLDPAFGSGGIARRSVASELGGTDHPAWKLALQPDGKVVYVGPVWRAGIPSTGVGRIDRFGRWDDTFDGDGVRDLTHTGNDNPVDLALDANGRIFVVFSPVAVDRDTGIFGLLSNGTPDPGWNGGAPVVVDLTGNDEPGAIRTDRFGNVIATSAGTLGGAQRQQVTIRRLPTGAPDTSFGGPNGRVGVLIGDSLDKPSGIHDVDGRIVLTGHTRVGTRDVVYVARMSSRTIGDWAAGRTWSTGTTSMFATCLRSLSGATANWTVDPDANCTAVDSDPWRGVPAAFDSTSKVGSTASTATATARLRFGLRVASTEPPGAFHAPLAFSVVAPAI